MMGKIQTLAEALPGVSAASHLAGEAGSGRGTTAKEKR